LHFFTYFAAGTHCPCRAHTAYITKCGFGADNQHYHPHQTQCFSTGKCHAIRT